MRTRLDAARGASVLSGGGGVGKSQLAAAYAHQGLESGLDLLLWLDASTLATLIAGYADAARRIQDSEAQGADPSVYARRLLDWLAVTDRSWLVVLDDITDPRAINGWWPPASRTGTGRTLATTRSRDATVSGAGRTVTEVEVYEPAESRAYLAERLSQAGNANLLDDSVDALAADLGHLPLALGHAAAYMINDQLTCTGYRELLLDRTTQLDQLLPETADTEGYGRRPAAALLLALEAVQVGSPGGLATRAITLAALLDPAGHPEALWSTDAVVTHLGAERSREARQAVVVLHRYALVTLDSGAEPRAVRIHALTARAVREAFDTRVAARPLADALLALWPAGDHLDRELAVVLRANTDVLVGHDGDALWRPDAHPLLFRAGISLLEAGLNNAALASWRALVDRAKREFGQHDPTTLRALGNLAACYRATGRVGDAIDLLERVLADCRQVLGDEDSETLSSRANLAIAYREADRVAEAIDLLEAVVADSERLLGADSPETLRAKANLAASYQEARRTDDAIVSLEQVLADSERAVAPLHPDSLRARAWLAASYWQARRRSDAIEIQERVLAECEMVLGSRHPDTVGVRAALASMYWQAGRTGDAIELQRQVVSDREHILGPQHPDTVQAHADLEAVERGGDR